MAPTRKKPSAPKATAAPKKPEPPEYSYASELKQGRRALAALGERELAPIFEVFAGLETSFGDKERLIGEKKNKGSYQGLFQFGTERMEDLGELYEHLYPKIGGAVAADVHEYLTPPPTRTEEIHPLKGQGVLAALQIHNLAERFTNDTGISPKEYGAMGPYAYHLFGTNGGKKLLTAFRDQPNTPIPGLVSERCFKSNFGNVDDPFARLWDLNPERWTPENITPAQMMELLHRKAAVAYLGLKEREGTTPEDLSRFRHAVWPHRSEKEVEEYVSKIPGSTRTGDIMRHMAYVMDVPETLVASPLPLPPDVQQKELRTLHGETLEDHHYPAPSPEAVRLRFMYGRQVIDSYPLLNPDGSIARSSANAADIPSPYLEHPGTRRLQEAMKALGEHIAPDGKLGARTAEKAIALHNQFHPDRPIVPQLQEPSNPIYAEKARNPQIWLVSSDVLKGQENNLHQHTIYDALMQKTHSVVHRLSEQEELTPKEWERLRSGLWALGFLDLKEYPQDKEAPVVQAALEKFRQNATTTQIASIQFDPSHLGDPSASITPGATPPTPRNPGRIPPR